MIRKGKDMIVDQRMGGWRFLSVLFEEETDKKSDSNGQKSNWTAEWWGWLFVLLVKILELTVVIK